MAFDLNAHPMLIKALEEANEALDEAMPLLTRASNAIEPTQHEAIFILLANIELTIATPLDEALRDDISSQRSSLKRYSRALRDEETDPRELRRSMSSLSSALLEVDEDAAKAGFDKSDLDADDEFAMEIDPAEHASELDQVRENVRASEADTIELEEEVKSSEIAPEKKSEALLELERLKLKLKGLGFELDLDAVGTIRFDLAAIVRGLASFAGQSARFVGDLLKLGMQGISATAGRLKRHAETAFSGVKALFRKVRRAAKRQQHNVATSPEPDKATRERWELEAAISIILSEAIPEERRSHIHQLDFSIHNHDLDQDLRISHIGRSRAIDLSQVNFLFNLRKLNLTGTRFLDSQKNNLPIQMLEKLEDLRVGFSNLRSLSFASRTTKLKKLAIDNTEIEDLSEIVHLSQLQELSMEDIRVTSLEPICELKSLEGLNLYGSDVKDLSPLRDLTNIKKLAASEPSKIDSKILRHHDRLEFLEVHFSNINLNDFPHPQNITRLAITADFIQNLESIAKFESLQTLFIYDCYINNVDFEKIVSNESITHIGLTNCIVGDIRFLQHMKNLRTVNLEYSEVDGLALTIGVIADTLRAAGIDVEGR